MTKSRLPVFTKDHMKMTLCKAIDESRSSGGFSLYAYVIMPDHMHLITDSRLSSRETLRFVNGVTSRRIIDYLKTHGYETSLHKLRRESGRRKYTFSLWDHHADTRLLLTEEMLMQRVTYTHQNPVRGKLVSHPNEYRWSSVRCWNRKPLDDEPLLMDLDKIKWRRSV